MSIKLIKIPKETEETDVIDGLIAT